MCVEMEGGRRGRGGGRRKRRKRAALPSFMDVWWVYLQVMYGWVDGVTVLGVAFRCREEWVALIDLPRSSQAVHFLLSVVYE